jgi:hypothetical protein
MRGDAFKAQEEKGAMKKMTREKVISVTPKLNPKRNTHQFTVKSTSVTIQFVVQASSPQRRMRRAAITAFSFDAAWRTQRRLPPSTRGSSGPE